MAISLERMPQEKQYTEILDQRQKRRHTYQITVPACCMSINASTNK